MNFTFRHLDFIEDQVFEEFDDIKDIDEIENIEEGLHMWLVDILAYRLLVNGNWEADNLKEWMGDRVVDAQNLMLEFEKEESTIH